MSSKKKARAFASTVHAGDKYNGGSYVENHLDKASELVEELLDEKLVTTDIPLDTLQTIAYLHDTIEDHPDKVNKRKLQAKFGNEVADAVHTLTHTKQDLDYAEHIVRVIQGPPAAAIVKLADLGANLEAFSKTKKPSSYEKQRAVKYKLAALLITYYIKDN